MHLLAVIPATLRLLLAFVLVLILIRRRLSLGTTFMLGSAVMVIFFPLPPQAILGSLVASVTYPKTLALAVIVSLILVLSRSMESSGQMKRLLDAFEGIVLSPRLNLVVFPALIGLLPMPGGAVFSAPMVRELGVRHGLGGQSLSFINYWFRHIWEYWWPLYPGVLLAVTLAECNLLTFMLSMFPLTLAAVFCGMLGLRRLVPVQRKTPEHERRRLGPFLWEVIPIMIVVVIGLGAGTLLTGWCPSLGISREIGLIGALLLGIGWVWRVNRLDLAAIGRLVADRHLMQMVYMIFAILIFKGIIEDSQEVGEICRELMAAHTPLVGVVVTLPLLVGLVSGITIAFVGTTFPILVALVRSYGVDGALLPYLLLAYSSGLMGVMLSPVHLCLLLSNAYFGVTLGGVYRLIVRSSFGVLACALICFAVLSRLI